LHAAATFSRTIFSPPSRKCPSWAAPARVNRRRAKSPSSGSDRKQADDVAREGCARSKRRWACRQLHRLIVIDAIGYGVILAAADGRSCDHQFGAANAAVNGEGIEEPSEPPRENVLAATTGV
jgi:hypothetical protein